MASFDPGNSRQIIAALTSNLAHDSQNNHCPRCNCFGIVSGMDEHYGKIYRCKCLPVFWVISPETGEKLERG